MLNDFKNEKIGNKIREEANTAFKDIKHDANVFQETTRGIVIRYRKADGKK